MFRNDSDWHNPILIPMDRKFMLKNIELERDAEQLRICDRPAKNMTEKRLDHPSERDLALS